MAQSIRLNDRVKVTTRHWKCAGQEGSVVAFDSSKVNKYLVRFEREVPGTLRGQELWLGDQDLQHSE